MHNRLAYFERDGFHGDGEVPPLRIELYERGG
jgi:hypothetical protein